MKRILFTLLFVSALSSVVHAQATLQLKHDSLSIWVGQYEHPLNTLRARFIDTDSTLAIWGTDNTVFSAARKYNAYTDDSNTPFATYAALKAYVRQYFFVDASGSGSGAGGDLQATTDLGNSTSNAIQVTGLSGLSAVNDTYKASGFAKPYASDTITFTDGTILIAGDTVISFFL